MKYLVVGCGLAGSVIAERIANVLKSKVTIIEKRNHIGGNCYDYIDKETNILVNKYGPHIFHTNDEDVWNYVNKFDEWIRWEHKVLSYVDDKFVSIPVNITTINELCNQNLQNEEDGRLWLEQNTVKYDTIENSEEVAKSRIGTVLYEKLIKDYTFKQWNKFPNEMDKSVLERIPVRCNFDTRYFSDKYQALPHKGYTKFFENLLKNDLIEIILNTDYIDYIQNNNYYDIIIFTGPIDTYFPNLPKLEYRSINFDKKIIKNMNYYQPASIVNYPEKQFPYTRIVEYKHFLNQKSNDTVIISETTTDEGEPYYPVPTKKNMNLYKEYQKLAIEEEKKNVFFIGRLANYKYFNMDETIKNSLNFFDNVLLKL